MTEKSLTTSSCDTSWLSTFYSYDSWGNQTSTTDARGVTTSTQYDTSGNWPKLYAYPTNVTVPLIGTTSYLWNKQVGQVEKVSDVNGVESNSRYDEWGRLLKMWKVGDSEGDPTQWLEYYDYESTFRILQVTRSDAGPLEKHTFYDGLGREVQTKSTYINAAQENKHAVTLTKYNPLGPIVSYAPIELPATTTYYGPTEGVWNDKSFIQSEYDSLGRGA